MQTEDRFILTRVAVTVGGLVVVMFALIALANTIA